MTKIYIWLAVLTILVIVLLAFSILIFLALGRSEIYRKRLQTAFIEAVNLIDANFSSCGLQFGVIVAALQRGGLLEPEIKFDLLTKPKGPSGGMKN